MLMLTIPWLVLLLLKSSLPGFIVFYAMTCELIYEYIGGTVLMVAFFLNSAIAPNGLEVSMGARETVCGLPVLVLKADKRRKELVKFVRLQCVT
jgi:hypothetical protein